MPGFPIRTIKKAGLFDVSPVTYPAYPQTDCAVRSLTAWQDSQKQNSAAYEESLRDYQRAINLNFRQMPEK